MLKNLGKLKIRKIHSLFIRREHLVLLNSAFFTHLDHLFVYVSEKETNTTWNIWLDLHKIDICNITLQIVGEIAGYGGYTMFLFVPPSAQEIQIISDIQNAHIEYDIKSPADYERKWIQRHVKTLGIKHFIQKVMTKYH